MRWRRPAGAVDAEAVSRRQSDGHTKQPPAPDTAMLSADSMALCRGRDTNAGSKQHAPPARQGTGRPILAQTAPSAQPDKPHTLCEAGANKSWGLRVHRFSA